MSRYYQSLVVLLVAGVANCQYYPVNGPTTSYLPQPSYSRQLNGYPGGPAPTLSGYGGLGPAHGSYAVGPGPALNGYGGSGVALYDHPSGSRVGSGFVGNPGIGIRQTGATLGNIYGQPFYGAPAPRPNLSPMALAANGARFGLSGLSAQAGFGPAVGLNGFYGGGQLDHNGYGMLPGYAG